MKTLHFIPSPMWPLNSGGRLRNFELARGLAARSRLTVVDMCETGNDARFPADRCGFEENITLEKGRRYTPFNICRGLAGPTPVTVLNHWSRQSASALAKLVGQRQFDTVQVEGMHLLEYLPIIQQTPGAPSVVLDWHNIESELMWRYARTAPNVARKVAAMRTAKLIQRAEDRLLRSDVTHTVTSERERQKLLTRSVHASIYVVPNGIDTKSFAPRRIIDASREHGQWNSRQTLLFVGSMDYHANIDAVTWFVGTAWPDISRRHPNLHFTIVGRDPAPVVRALESEFVHVTGTVDDVRPYYASAVAGIVPLRSGSGTRLKILEAMAAGVPVVSTRLGAEGLDVDDGVNILLADRIAEVVAAVDRFSSCTEARTMLTEAARALVVRAYDWSVIGDRLLRIHENLAESRTSTSIAKAS